MSRSEPIHLIIADPSANNAEEIVSELRNAGHATRAQHVANLEELDALLTRQHWDLMICRRDGEAEYEPEELIARIRQHELDCATILIEDGSEPERLTRGLQDGATDVILDGEDERFLLVVRRELGNVAERRQRRLAESLMKESERRNQLLLDSSRSAIAYVHDGMHVYANRAYAELFRYADQDDLAAVPLLDMISPEDQATFKKKLKDFDAKASEEAFPVSGVRRDGSRVEGNMTLTMAAFDGEPCMQVLIHQDEATASNEEIELIRSMDPTTGLLNRPFFLERVEQAVETANREQRGGGGLLLLQIDDFPALREQAGLTGTDAVVREVAEVIAGVDADGVVLGRLGDDNFAALVQDRGPDELQRLATAYLSAVEAHLFSARQKTLRLTLSIGVTLIDGRSGSLQEVLAQATQASSHVRVLNKRGNASYLFEPADFTTNGEDNSEDPSQEREEEILRFLSDGIKNNTLPLLYQPIISLHGEEREHYEVYLRLPDGRGNLLTPDDFIHLAERAGMGGRLDRWVVLQSVRRLAARRAEGRDIRLTINLTHNALTDDSFLPWLKVALKAAKLPKEAVVMQFTETAANTYLKQAKTFSESLARLDCAVSLSRFGTSADPFSTLHHLDVAYVKLDGTLVSDIHGDEPSRKRFRDFIKRLNEGGHQPIIPMVADAQILAQLFQAGVNYVQGNYFAEPASDMDYEFQSDV